MNLNDLYDVNRVGFYLVSGERELLKKMIELMSKKGYLGITDTGGRVHYLLDARHNLYRTADTAAHLAEKLAEDRSLYQHDGGPEGAPVRLNPAMAGELVEEVLLASNFSPHLRGYTYLKYLLIYLAQKKEAIINPLKELKFMVADRYQISSDQAERVMRYAVNKSGLAISLGKAIQYLNSKVRERADQLNIASRKA